MDIEKWNVDNLVDACSAKPFGNKKMKIPSVQRLRVWTPEQENDLILTLKLNKISIGNLQTYKLDPVGKKETYLLADGLNRCTTIVNYFNDPFSFGIAQQSISNILSELTTKYKKSQEESNLQTLCGKWFCKENLGGYRDFVAERTYDERTDELMDIVAKHISTTDKDNIYKFLFSKTKELSKELDISKAVIGVTVNSDITTLPLLFEKINQNGTPLSTCDVLAATWAKKCLEITNTDILSCIDAHYNDLRADNNGMELYSVTGGKHTVYDYVNGLSRHVKDKYTDTFYGSITDKEFVFKLLSMIFVGEASKKGMTKLDDLLLKENLTKLEEKLFWVFDYVQEVLDPLVLIRVKSKEDGYVMKSIVKESAFYIGLMTYLFVNKQKIEKKLEDIKVLIRLNLINDKLSGTSFSAKIITALTEDRKYANKPSFEEFSSNLVAHSERTIKENKKIDAVSQLVLKFMSILMEIENDSLEFGTVIAKKELTDFNKDSKEFLPINAFGNLCVYDFSGVPKKPSEGVVKYLGDQDISEDLVYQNYIYVGTEINHDELVVRQLITKKNYLKFLRYRVNCIKNLIKENCSNYFTYDEDENEDENGDENDNQVDGDDQDIKEEVVIEKIEEKKPNKKGKSATIKFTKPTGRMLTK